MESYEYDLDLARVLVTSLCTQMPTPNQWERMRIEGALAYMEDTATGHMVSWLKAYAETDLPAWENLKERERLIAFAWGALEHFDADVNLTIDEFEDRMAIECTETLTLLSAKFG